MAYRPVHFRWVWDLRSTPEAFWPFVADTDRLNHDSGLPTVQNRLDKGERLDNARRRLRMTIYGVAMDYDEQPFEWVRPVRYGVARRYLPHPLNPVAEFRMLAELEPRAGGGTRLTYQVWATPANFLGVPAIPIQIGLLNYRLIDRAVRRYDQAAASRGTRLDLPAFVELAPGAGERLAAARAQLTQAGQPADLVDRLLTVLEKADDQTVARLRPYTLADRWGQPRREVLELCLRATRAGLLDFRWDVLCPNCRGAQLQAGTLSDVSGRPLVHCDTCNIDYTANLERSVELTFHPNAAIRPVVAAEFCVAGPQVTPHIAIQQLLKPGEQRDLTAALEPGRYRLRALELPGGQFLNVADDGQAAATVPVNPAGWPAAEPTLAARATLRLVNGADREHLVILERAAWSDQAVLAADVTALQVFRDLFANEALRPGEQISVGSLTVLFTDLRGSTRLYREIGDAPAFGLVMNHFDVLRDAIAAEDGAIVKNIGDAVMAVFRRPAAAVRAILRAQRTLAAPAEPLRPLLLKVGIPSGPCIGVPLNQRLDSFGSTVNAASRLVELSDGSEVVLSTVVRQDPEVAALLADPVNGLRATPDMTTLKGFDDERFEIWRVRRAG